MTWSRSRRSRTSTSAATPRLACSADTQKVIDDKVVALVKTQHEKAKKILAENRSKLDVLAQYLYEKETITGEEFMAILEREEAKA